MRCISVFLCQLRDDTRGSISILAGFMLVSVVGVSALALEYGHGLLQKTENQRAADLAAYGGALVYNSTGSTDSASSAATNIAALNGLSSGVTPSYVLSPSGDGNHAIKVTATTNLPLHLARVLTSNTTLPVTATAYAEIVSTAPGCIIALSNGITMNGGTHITANNCAVAANAVSPAAALALAGSAQLVTKVVDYNTTYSVGGGASITKPGGGSPTYSNVFTPDPLIGNSAVSSAVSHLSTVAAITSPTAPTISPLPSGGKALSFAYSVVPASSLPTNCTDSYASSTHTVTCTGNGPFNIASLSLGGGLKLNFNTGGSSSAVYNFSSTLSNTSGDTMAFGPGTFTVNGSITNSGTLTFGAGTFKVNGSITNSSGTLSFGAGSVTATNGIATGGGTTTTFGAGTFTLGQNGSSCNGSTNYSICNTGTSLTFAGPSTFVLSGGIYNGGGETLTLGSSGTTTNSYNIGKATDGNSIYAGGGATTTLYDATGTGDLFQTAGNIASSGGTCLWIPAAAAHDINGYISLAGGTTLGTGVYTVTGYVAFGSNGGGDVTCGGSSVGVSGSNVTLVINGTTVASGSCAGTAFCVAAGFGHVTLTAPTSGTDEQLLVVGPPSTSAHKAAGATFAEGASGTTLTGAFYFPNGPVSLSGSGTINNAGGCLELVGSQITLAGGSAATSTCSGLGGGSGSGVSVSLVQ